MDRVVKFLAYDGKVSVIVAETTELAEYIRNLHDLSPTMTAAMGRFSTIVGMMGLSDTKENSSRITVQLKGDGPAGTLVGIVRRDDNISKIKAYAENPQVEPPLKSNGKLDVGAAVGSHGYLNIIKKSLDTDAVYNGVVTLTSGEIAEDFTKYFAESEQKPTVIALGVLVNSSGVVSSGGYMINLMPDAGEEEISKIETAISNVKNVSNLISDGMTVEEIAKLVTGDENVKVIEDDLKIVYECDCSREIFERGLISLGRKQLEEIIEVDHKADVVCHFCNKQYHFSEDELKLLIENL